eukprot:131818-Pelagomonas_calceolata.AAC.3
MSSTYRPSTGELKSMVSRLLPSEDFLDRKPSSGTPYPVWSRVREGCGQTCDPEPDENVVKDVIKGTLQASSLLISPQPVSRHGYIPAHGCARCPPCS